MRAPPIARFAVLSDASVLERLALGSVEFGDGDLVTHTDEAYIRRHYGGDPTSEVHYYARSDPRDPNRVESSYNPSRYQPHLAEKGLTVLQTVDPIDRVDPEKVIVRRRFRHNNHSASHLARMLPLLRLTQGRRRTYFAGSYTLLNAHEIAILYGLAAAEHLGAPYPFRDDPAASQPYGMYRRLLGGGRPPDGSRPAGARSCLGSRHTCARSKVWPRLAPDGRGWRRPGPPVAPSTTVPIAKTPRRTLSSLEKMNMVDGRGAP